MPCTGELSERRDKIRPQFNSMVGVLLCALRDGNHRWGNYCLAACPDLPTAFGAENTLEAAPAAGLTPPVTRRSGTRSRPRPA